MKLYTLQRQLDGDLHLIAQSEIADKNAKGRTIGSHIETEATSGHNIGNISEESLNLAATIMLHYFGSDEGGRAEAQRQCKRFHEAFLIHHEMPPGARLEISSEVLDRFFSA